MSFEDAIREDPLANRIYPVVIIYIFNENNEVLLFKRQKNPFLNFWEPAGGKINFKEKIIDAVIRETKEETEISLPEKNIRFVGAFDHIFGNTYHRILLCFASRISNNSKIKLSEHKKCEWFKIHELPESLIPA
ncbi:MAG: NUDIX domain-containing protein, partial [Candidatus Aenigmarchaeota archaeon]|nr:NUDIX domain-containing protein [Candidatus Aenigmarchaeota archaeon]